MRDIEIGTYISTVREDHGKSFLLPHAARNKPIYIIGSVRSGKTTLMENIMMHDIEDNQGGFVFIEPTWNRVAALADHIPPERHADTIVIDWADLDYHIPISLFADFHDPQYRRERRQIVAMLMLLFQRLFGASWDTAVRMRRLLEHSFQALTEIPGATFLTLQRICEDDAYRQDITSNILHPISSRFWQTFDDRKIWSAKDRRESVQPILNRIEHLFIDDQARHILCQSKNTINFTEHIRNGGIILVNLGREENGEEIAGLLGSILFTKLYVSALSLNPATTPPFTFYLDDFTEYALPVFPTTFSSSPHLRFVLTHQNLAQLHDHPAVRATLLANAGTTIAFNLGIEDAKIFDEIFDIDVGRDVYIPKCNFLPDHTAHIKVEEDGSLWTHHIKSVLPYTPQHNMGADLIEHSRVTYGTKAKEVEEEIRAWYAPSEDAEGYIDLS